jgi:hypothetical protein
MSSENRRSAEMDGIAPLRGRREARNRAIPPVNTARYALTTPGRPVFVQSSGYFVYFSSHHREPPADRQALKPQKDFNSITQ